MAMTFPSNPTTGQQYSVSGGPTYTWDGTVWKILTPGSQFSEQQFTATAGQTSFTVSGGYVIGAVDVYRNGVKLVVGVDFTATDLSTVVLSNAASAGDTIEVVKAAQILYADALKATNNLSDVGNAATALSNLGGLPKAGGTMTGPVTFNGSVTNAASITRHTFATTNQGVAHSRYEVMRISRDPANWGAIPVEITVTNNYYRGGVTKWFVSYNQVDSGTVSCLSCSGTHQHKVFLGSEVTVSANLRYVPIIVEIPYYTSVSIEVAISGNQVSSISSAWQYQLTGTYSTGDGTFHSGVIDLAGGLKFPAAQNASSDPNTLDDYEEGTWTPVVTGSYSNPTVSYANQFGYYTKIGDTVTAHVNVTANSRSGGSGSVLVSLPFPISSANQFLAQSALEFRGVTLNSGYTHCGTLCVYGSGTRINLRQYGSGQAELDLDMANVATGQFTFRFTAVYKV